MPTGMSNPSLRFYILKGNYSMTMAKSKEYIEHSLFTHSHTMTPFEASGETSVLKTLWEKEKLLITSNFSFSHNVF